PAAFAPPAAVPLHRVGVRLTTGELIDVAAHEDEGAARAEAPALMRSPRDGRGDWPFLAGRFVRPETIVSIDVDSVLTGAFPIALSPAAGPLCSRPGRNSSTYASKSHDSRKSWTAFWPDSNRARR